MNGDLTVGIKGSRSLLPCYILSSGPREMHITPVFNKKITIYHFRVYILEPQVVNARASFQENDPERTARMPHLQCK